MVSPVVLILLLSSIQLGFIYFTHTILAQATYDASRTIRLGINQKQGLGQAGFVTQVCTELGNMVPCSGVQVNVQSGGSFAALNTVTPVANGVFTNPQWSPGAKSVDVKVQVGYYMPCLVSVVCSGLTSGSGVFLLATNAFQNEAF